MRKKRTTKQRNKEKDEEKKRKIEKKEKRRFDVLPKNCAFHIPKWSSKSSQGSVTLYLSCFFQQLFAHDLISEKSVQALVTVNPLL